MPITVIQDYTWKQTNDKIFIEVPLHGMHPSKADIFTSSQYIKVSNGSFFFEVMLLHPVNVSQIICTKTPTQILFDLKKSFEGIWNSLEVLNLNKQEKNKLRKILIQEEHARIQKQSEEKVNKKAELKRVAINEQIELDTKVRNHIENVKKMEEVHALGNINEWKKDIEAPKKDILKIIEPNKSKSDYFNLNTSEAAAVKGIEQDNNNSLKYLGKGHVVFRTVASKSEFKEKKYKTKPVPQPRLGKSLQILFTPREFPTPCRESQLEEENEFLRKQAEARRSAGFVDEDLKPEEKNPQFLLAKGKEFLKNKNYLGAISAFSFGIKLNPKLSELYVVRSEAHIAVGNFRYAVEDCTSALELLKPPLPINLDDRALCIGRRGISLSKLSFLRSGISELEQSLKLKKNREFEIILEQYKLDYNELNEN